MTTLRRRTLLAAIALILLVTGYNGVIEGLNALRLASTTGQRFATISQLTYGGLAVAALMAVATRYRFTTAVLGAWASAVVITAALAPIVYAGASASVAIAVALFAIVVTGGVISAWRRVSATSGGAVPPAAWRR